MDLTGLLSNIYEAAIGIDAGRRGFATKGKAEEGRVLYEEGIALALFTFRDAASTLDPRTIVLAEYTFLSQELQFCDEVDTDTFSSLTKAIESFDDAFLALEIVEDHVLYKGAEKTYPHSEKFRVSGYPKDSFHLACIAHRTRLQNVLRSPGIAAIEKFLLKQRFANLSTTQIGYLEKQKKALVKYNFHPMVESHDV